MESHNEMMTFESHAITIMKIEEPLWIPADCKNAWISALIWWV